MVYILSTAEEMSKYMSAEAHPTPKKSTGNKLFKFILYVSDL